MPRILIADDDPAFRQMARLACQVAGHEVFEAADAVSALHAQESALPDLLVLDIKMPGGGGEMVMTTLRRRKAACRVLVVTGVLEGAEEVLRIHLGVDGVLRKPVRMADIATAIHRILGGDGAEPESAQGAPPA